MAEDKPRVQAINIREMDDIRPALSNTPKARVRPNSVKTADPGVAFVLETEDQTPFDHALTVRIKVTDDQNHYHTSSLSVGEKVYDNAITCIVPFGDKDWSQFVQRVAKQSITTVDINFTIEFILCDPATGAPSIDPVIITQDPIELKDVNAQSGTFEIAVTPTLPQAGRKGGLFRRLFGRR